MTFDRKDFTESLGQKHARAQREMLPMARILAGAAPVMDKLQRTEEWGRYCTYLQGVSERYVKAKENAQRKLGDPSITKDDEVRKLRQDIFIADVTVETLKFAIELPAYILKGGEDADQFIATFEKKNEPAEQPKS